MGIKIDFEIKTSDGSFYYDAPYGTEIHHCVNRHGFEITTNDNYDYDISTINGYGEYAYLDEYRSKSVGEFITELDTILLNGELEEDCTPEECFEELLENLREQALMKEVA